MYSVSLLKYFEKLSDPRMERTKKYPLEEILLLIISAGISGCIGWKAIKDSVNSKIRKAALSDSFREDVLHRTMNISVN